MAEEQMKITKVYVLNTGGTLGMVGNPLRAAKSAADLMEGIPIPKNVELTLDDFKIRQDSTNLLHAERVMIAKQIASKYEDFDAFVIMHGTDSMAETCAAFCMFFKNTLQKPLLVIGAQMTKDEVGSDVQMQLSNTFRVCSSFDRYNIVGVYNVCIGDVWDGSRLKKRAESNFMAFYTPGRNPVARVWPHVHFDEGLRYKDTVLAAQMLRLDSDLEKRVGTIRVSADTPPWMLMDMVAKGRLKGVILECKGAGQIPNREWTDYDNDTSYSWIDAIAAATKAGIHVGILSPFEDGRVILDRYELGALAKEAGAISLESLTPDMADLKFRHAIALWPDDPTRIQEFISTNLVGELLTGVEDEG
jgi:L-asparaginase